MVPGGGGYMITVTAAQAVNVQVSEAAPDMPVNFTSDTVSPASTVFLHATAPNSANVSAIQFYRHNTSGFSGATNISGPIFVAPNQTAAYDDTPGSGTWYYWATALSAISPPSESLPAGPRVAIV